jgi:hypothetical protein
VSSVPAWAWIATLAGVAGMLVAFVRALPDKARRPAVVILGLWVMLVGTLAVAGAFVQDPAADVVPWIGPVIVVALVLAVGGLREVGGVDPATLTAVQTYRVVGGVFVALLLVGQLPPVFALPAGLGDLAVGLAAPVIARRLRRGDRRGARTFHVLGIVDLVVAVGTGFLSAPGPFGVLAGAVTSAPLTLLPLVLVPTTLVPLSVAMHLHVLHGLNAGVPRAPARA